MQTSPKTIAAVVLVTSTIAATASFAATEFSLMECGESSGKSYNFDGKGWIDDVITNGQIFLVRNAGGVEGNFDIRFSDAFGGYGYALDGAEVVQATSGNGKFSFIAFHANYTDQYTFDPVRGEVLWTQHKTGTIVQKVSMFYAECSS